VILLKIVLPKDEYVKFFNGIEKIFNNYKNNLKSVEFQKIINSY